MTVTLWQRLDKAGRNLAPFAVTVMLLLLGLVPLRIPAYTAVAPSLTLMAVYYWTIHRPDLLRPGAVFALGLLEDLLSGAPLGLNALVMVTAHWVVLTQRRFFLASTFPLMWFGFALIVFGAAVMEWMVFSVLNTALLPFRSMLFQALLTLALFPAFTWLFVRVHRAFLP
ncbi:rod shape-determining protein MreD [Azospirillum sp.]|uniref:rod shape-determining protein MreD n=1 Tax=Azospirillum sp. TaxID=34012 RepID=UPI002D54FE85|nr:rod shape-determining protein MreD [Azospirillum sp.]HYD66781.1 rod shape-determining protein MreD [Azospirillum sp.]